jgi:phenylacetic acid degradation operon negative regulatory protein
MNAKSEVFLYLLLWGAETLARPTFHKLTESFEGWAYRRGLHRQLSRLEREALLESKPDAMAGRIYRLTEQGRLLALGGRDPVARWKRPWDGKWRLVLFDLPEQKNTARVRLRRFLKDQSFGYLQNSVWITPDPLSELTKQLSGFGEDVEALVTLEARPCAGESDHAIVAGAWDFRRINRLYEKCIAVLNGLPGCDSEMPQPIARLQRWARLEQASWWEAVHADPLLPEELLPREYRGKDAWQLRTQVLKAASRILN